MIALTGSILSSVLFGHIMKLANVRRANLLWVGFFNYLAASLICWGAVAVEPPRGAVGFTLIVGTCAGVSFLLSLLYYFAAVARLGMSLATAAIRMSVALPVIAALLIWHEQLNLPQALGLGLVGLALLLLSAGAPVQRYDEFQGTIDGGEPVVTGGSDAPSRRWGLSRTSRRPGASLLLGLILPLFAITGSGQLAARIYSGGAPAANALLYSAATFSAACLSAFIPLRCRPQPIAAQDLWLGIVLGASNTITNLLLLRALRELPSAEVFSVSSAASVSLAALTGVLVWREQLSVPAIASIVCAACAVVLLTR